MELPTELGADYSFAIEYVGPPVPYAIPEAVPLEIDRIPLAAVAPPSSLPSTVAAALPVAHPLPSPLKKPPPPRISDPPAVVSPTSVIDAPADAADRETSGEVVFSSDLKGSADRVSTDSPLSSEFGFRSSASEDENDFKVTFEEDSAEWIPEQQQQQQPETRGKRGSCYRCLKGNKFTEKEACLVCDNKYCSNCLLRAMGSMPEGRKCVSCIGRLIQESKREKLGKSSRVLRRLLSSLEVEQVMKAERYCEVNQLRAQDVWVNRKQLSMEEMVVLRSCPRPPAKLKPGYYWYDKVSGLWGKEGHKPDKIVTPNLNVGGSLMRNASNGSTGILINGREISKVEMQMLKWAGVQCAGNPHFWVNADGTYQEEGQKNIKGQIWGRARTKLFCSLLSLPIPSKAVNSSGDEVNNMLDRAVVDYLEQRTLQKLLLVGYDGSGTSTIFKQAKFLYNSIPFSEDEREHIKLMIQSNIYSYLGILLEGRERFEEESLAEKRNKKSIEELDECDKVTVYSISPRLKSFSDWLLKVMASGNLEAIFPAATREYAPRVEELWNDPAIRATYSRRKELQLLPAVASYFLERVVDISRMEYEPSDMDILYAEGITSSNGLGRTEFFFPQSDFDGSSIDAADQQDKLLRYQLIRIHTKDLGGNCKWLDMFEDVRIIMFCVSVSDYDEYYEDANGLVVNKMMETRRLFESVVTHQSFGQVEFLLVLNKFDLLERKIEEYPLTLCDWFDDFHPVMSRHRTSGNRNNLSNGAVMAQQAFHFIAVKFKRLFASLTGRKLYVTSANGLDSESVDAALRYAREILKWEEDRPAAGDFSITEPTSFSN